MLRTEFDAACKECSKSYKPESVTDEMYSTIEFVYVWYSYNLKPEWEI